MVIYWFVDVCLCGECKNFVFQCANKDLISVYLLFMFGKCSAKVDSLDNLNGSNTLDQMMDDGATHQPAAQKPVWCERKQAVVQEEIRKMNRLPANSTYVSHRLKVLNKILQLMSVQVGH